jgi:imidazolonepropionase-like amidohydrolase
LTKESDLSLFQERWNDLIAQDMGEELMDLTPDELRGAMRGYLAKGVDVVKYGGTSHFIRPSLIGFSPAQQRAIVETAHENNIAVQTHATSLEGLRLAVEAGLDLIQHPELMARDLPDTLVRQIVKSGAYCGIRANYLTGEEWKRQLAARQAAQRRVAALPPATTSAERWRRFDAVGEGEEIQRRNAERLIRAGCPVTIATDVFLGDAPEFRRTPKPDTAEPGIGSILAIEGLVELGMTPGQAIVAATRNGAAAARRLDRFGTIGKGKAADLVLLDADPLSDIRNIRRVSAVWAQGRRAPIERLPEAPLFSPKP